MFNMMNLMSMLGSGVNPQQMIQNEMMKNPKNSQMLTQLQNSIAGSGMNPKDYAMQFFKQKGINEQQVMEIAKRFGLK